MSETLPAVADAGPRPEPDEDARTDAAPSTRGIHLNPTAAAMLAASPQERIEFIETDRWIGYPKAEEVVRMARDLVRAPRTTSPRGALVLGRPGNGKSTIVKRIADEHAPLARVGGGVTSPLVSWEFAPGADLSTFWSDVLLACGTVHDVRDSPRLKKQQAVGALTTKQPRAFLLDEVNEIAKARPQDQKMLVGELKWLSNHFSAPLIMFGTLEAADVVRFDRPLTRRSPDVILETWNGNADLPDLLDVFESILPLPERSYLSDDDMIDGLKQLHDGTIGSIAVVLRQAAKIAIKAGLDRIDGKVLERVTPDTEEARMLRQQRL
jgi:hypothetical protein